jgi:glutamyl-tRNA synthetase
MEINLVLRGEDHISNSPKQILLYRALGLEPPRFGHAPLIVGMDRARLSKRHGATKVGAYREMGVLPEAMCNFLALIGWAPSGHSEAANQEIFTRDELVKYFNPGEIGKAAGAFNMEKLENMNAQYIRSLSPAEFYARVRPFLSPNWLEEYGAEYTQRALALFQDKLTFLSQAQENAWYFFMRPRLEEPQADAEGNVSYVGYYNPKTVEKFLTGNDAAKGVLVNLMSKLEQVPAGDWDEGHLGPLVDAACEDLGLGKGKVMQPWRVALTGDKISPGFYDLVGVLGKDETLARVKPWVERLGG